MNNGALAMSAKNTMDYFYHETVQVNESANGNDTGDDNDDWISLLEALPDVTTFDIIHTAYWRTFFGLFYSLLIFISFVANVHIIAVIFRKAGPMLVINLFILCLSMSDLSQCLLNYPVQLYEQLQGMNWTLGRTLCYIVNPLFAVPMYVSVLTMLLISIERYQMIVHPHRRRVTFTMALVAVSGVVVLSVVLASPLIAVTKYVPTGIRKSEYFCYEQWFSDELKVAYGFLTFIFQFCAPVTTTAFLYSMIYMALQRRSATSPHARQRNLLPTDTRTSNASEHSLQPRASAEFPFRPHHRSNRKSTAILITTVAVFVICWMPYHVFTLFLDLYFVGAFGSAKFEALVNYMQIIDLFVKALPLASTTINPILYGWLNAGIRQQITGLWSDARLVVGGRICTNSATATAAAAVGTCASTYAGAVGRVSEAGRRLSPSAPDVRAVGPAQRARAMSERGIEGTGAGGRNTQIAMVPPVIRPPPILKQEGKRKLQEETDKILPGQRLRFLDLSSSSCYQTQRHSAPQLAAVRAATDEHDSLRMMDTVSSSHFGEPLCVQENTWFLDAEEDNVDCENEDCECQGQQDSLDDMAYVTFFNENGKESIV